MLPVYIITIVLLAAIFWLSSLTSDFLPSHYADSDGKDYIYYGVTSWPTLMKILIPSLIASMALPFITFAYQRKRVRADFYYQLPLKKKAFRRNSLLISLIILLSAITIIYWVGIIIIAAKQNQANLADEYFVNHQFHYNFLLFIPYYFYLIIGIGLNFFISSFFVSLGTRTIDSILYLLFGQIFIAFIVFALLFNVWGFMKFSINDSNQEMLNVMTATPSPSWLETIRGTVLFCEYITRGYVNLELSEFVTRIVCTSFYLLLGGFFTWYMLFFKKDPSGEYAGKGVPTNLLSFIFPHAFAFFVGLLISSVGELASISLILSIPSTIMSLVMWGVTYYFYMVLVNGGFHFSKKNWIAYGGVAGVTLIMTIINLIISHV